MDRDDRPTAEDDDIARLLRAAGTRKQLPGDMKQRWERQFRQELQPVLERRTRSRRRRVMGLCAGLALAVGALTLIQYPPAEPVPEIRVGKSSGQPRILAPGRDVQPVVAGENLAPGSIIETGAQGLVALQYGEHDLRLNRNTRLLLDADRLVLESGELYAGNRGPVPATEQLHVSTAHAEIRDVGTQFTVIAYPDRTVTTVRRGAVLVDTGREKLRAGSQPGSATRLTVDRELQVRREQVAPAGPDWNWIYRGGTDFTLEGRTAYEFLLWSVGESGLHLEFASRGAEVLARTTRLHGDIGGLDPDQAVQPVLASTDLVAQRTAGNSLRVTVAR